MDLIDWRNRIDVLDKELVRLLNERCQCVVEIGHIKRQQHLNVYDPARETEIMHNVLGCNAGPLPNEGLWRIFERILDESRRVERGALQINININEDGTR